MNLEFDSEYGLVRTEHFSDELLDQLKNEGLFFFQMAR
jgi:hypothetical protein